MVLIFLFITINIFNLINANFNNLEKNTILNIHNNMRSNLTIVPASNMLKLKWDNFLESEAKKLVDTCVFEHSTDNYGQNLFMGSMSDSIITRTEDGIILWYDEINEHKNFILENIQNSNKVGVGKYDHVSQILWAKTRLVGCSYNLCDNILYIACNYFPAGNFINMEWFLHGDSCSNCPNEFKFCDNNLCVEQEPTPTIEPTPPAADKNKC